MIAYSGCGVLAQAIIFLSDMIDVGKVPIPPFSRIFFPFFFGGIVEVVPPSPGTATDSGGIADRDDPHAFVNIDWFGSHVVAFITGLEIGCGLFAHPLLPKEGRHLHPCRTFWLAR